MNPPLDVVLAVAVGAFFTVVGFFLGRRQERIVVARETAAARDEASQILAHAQQEAENLRTQGELRGREEALQLRETWERDEDRRREEIDRLERRLEERSENLDRRLSTLDDRETELSRRLQAVTESESAVVEREQASARVAEEVQRRLESVSGLTAEEARKKLIADLEDEARAEAANTLRSIKEEAQRNAEREGKKIVALDAGYELGVSLGFFYPRPKIWFVRVPRLAIGYRFGGLNGLRIRIGGDWITPIRP